MNEQKKAAFLKAREAEDGRGGGGRGRRSSAWGRSTRRKALVGHAKGKWIGGADKGIAAAQAKLKKATTDAEREAAQEELAKWQKNREDGVRRSRSARRPSTRRRRSDRRSRRP